MRISTNMIYSSGTNGILNNQAAQLKTYNQITSGRRVVTPEDDPVAASQVLINTQAQEVNKRYMENQGQAKDSLKLVETQLNSAVNVLQEVLDKTIQAGNTTLNDANRAAIAEELQVRLDEMVALSNSQDGNGDEDFPHGSTSSWLRLSLGIPLRERKSFEPERSFPLTFFFVIPSSTRFPNYSVVYYTTFNFNR